MRHNGKMMMGSFFDQLMDFCNCTDCAAALKSLSGGPRGSCVDSAHSFYVNVTSGAASVSAFVRRRKSGPVAIDTNEADGMFSSGLW